MNRDNYRSSDDQEGWNFRLGAWLPWLPLLWLGVSAVGKMQGPLDELVPLTIYILISFPLGIAVCGYYRKDLLGFTIAAAILFGGPAMGLVFRNYESNRWAEKRQVAGQQLVRYCKELSGQKIYRKIARVDGVFRMDAPPADGGRGQYDAFSPWASQQRNSIHNLLADGNRGYSFVEYVIGSNSAKARYRRSSLRYKDNLENLAGEPYSPTKKNPFRRTQQPVDSLKSKYGWRIEDLTTKSMRDHWISGGTVQIVDLVTDELLAEHTGFYMGKGALEPSGAWSSAKHPIKDRCNGSYTLEKFLRKVLVPPKHLPSEERLDSLKE